MVGRNFWAMKRDGDWVVLEEGLPERTTTHIGRDEAWSVAQERAAELEGEAFLADDEGEICERKWFGKQPPDIKI
jgi:hypothetical protein